MSISQVCVRRKPAAISSHPVFPKNTPRIMKYSHIRCPSDCQHGHLTNSSESHPQKQPPSAPQTAPYCFYLLLFILTSVPPISSAVKCAHIGDARCVQTAPTDRQTHPAAFPASPLLHPSTSVTLTVKAHLSICASNCSLG